jgi:DNA-binding CsgD family transcriptional regulator
VKNEFDIPTYLVDSKSFFVAVIDLEGKYLFVNKKMQQDFHHISPNLIGESVKLTMSETDFNICENTVKSLIQRNNRNPIKVTIKKPLLKGEFQKTNWEFSLIKNYNGNELATLCVGFNVSESNNFNHLVTIHKKFQENFIFNYNSYILYNFNDNLKIEGWKKFFDSQNFESPKIYFIDKEIIDKVSSIPNVKSIILNIKDANDLKIISILEENFNNSKLILFFENIKVNILHSIYFKNQYKIFNKTFSVDEIKKLLLSPETLRNNSYFFSEENLSKREFEILIEVLNFKSNESIAEIFNISKRTVEVHINKILKKLDTKSRKELIELITLN